MLYDDQHDSMRSFAAVLERHAKDDRINDKKFFTLPKVEELLETLREAQEVLEEEIASILPDLEFRRTWHLVWQAQMVANADTLMKWMEAHAKNGGSVSTGEMWGYQREVRNLKEVAARTAGWNQIWTTVN